MSENEIAYQIRGAIYDVYNKLGPGLFELVYENALSYELKKRGLDVKSQVPINIVYDGIDMGAGFKMDLLVEDKVIIELKSVETLALVHHKQLLTYLKLTNLKLGILVNFNTSEINKSIIRKVNGL
jgi:GxxExxY protein